MDTIPVWLYGYVAIAACGLLISIGLVLQAWEHQRFTRRRFGVRPHPGGGRRGLPTWYSSASSPRWVVKTFGGISWSPDGSQLAFASDMDATGTFYVYTMPADFRKTHDRVGFYLFATGSIDNVKVFTKTDGGEWELQFQDDFERDNLGAEYNVRDGSVSIEAGRLNGSGTVMLAKSFPGAHRIEYDAVSDAERLGDLSAFISSTDAGFREGAFFGFGSNWNTHSKVMVYGEEVSSNREAVIARGKTHRILCERDGGRLRHVLDGQEIQTYSDAGARWVERRAVKAEPVRVPGTSSAWLPQVAWGSR